MDPFAIKPPPRASAVQGPLTLESPRGTVSSSELARDSERRGAREWADLIESARAAEAAEWVAPGEEVQVVRFEPVAMREGLVLVVAHVVSARLSQLCEQAEQARQQRARSSLPPAQARIEVALQAEDAFCGRALITVEGGALGPMTLELRLERGRLELHATVASARAAEAISSDQVLLEQALRMQGIALGSLSVEVFRRRERSAAGAERKTAAKRRQRERDRERERADDDSRRDKEG